MVLGKHQPFELTIKGDAFPFVFNQYLVRLVLWLLYMVKFTIINSFV